MQMTWDTKNRCKVSIQYELSYAALGSPADCTNDLVQLGQHTIFFPVRIPVCWFKLLNFENDVEQSEQLKSFSLISFFNKTYLALFCYEMNTICHISNICG